MASSDHSPGSPAQDRIRAITREVLGELGLGPRVPASVDSPAPFPAATGGSGAQGIQLVVFDMAGTTIRDDGEVLRCMLEAAAAHRLEVTAEEVNAFMGAAKGQVFEYFVTRQVGRPAPDRVEAVYSDFRRRLEQGYERGPIESVAGTLETFNWLHSRGIRVATTTGFYRRVTDILLRGLGWDRGIIDASLCVDDVSQGRPAPYMIFRAMELLGVSSVHQVIKVGDTPFDLMEGHNAGARGVIGVLSGAHGAETLGRARHTHLLPSVADLPDLIEKEF